MLPSGSLAMQNYSLSVNYARNDVKKSFKKVFYFVLKYLGMDLL